MSGTPEILIVDDEVQIRRLVRLNIEGAGYAVRESENGRQAVLEAANRPPDAILLDLGLPDLSGHEVLRQIREWSQVPIMILTIRTSDLEKVAALDAGADDYLTKPFSGAELLARLRAILRRVPKSEVAASYRIGAVEVDLLKRVVTKGGKEIRLSGKEFAVLRILLLNRGRVLTHRHILRECWSPAEEKETHYLRVVMNRLRQKLEKDPSAPAFLRTESGIGYRLVEVG